MLPVINFFTRVIISVGCSEVQYNINAVEEDEDEFKKSVKDVFRPSRVESKREWNGDAIVDG